MKYRSGLSERPDLQLVYLCLCVSSQRSSQMRKGILMREPRRMWAGIKHHVKCVSVGEKKKSLSIAATTFLKIIHIDLIKLIWYCSPQGLGFLQNKETEGKVQCVGEHAVKISDMTFALWKRPFCLFFLSYSASLFPQWDGFWIEGVRTVRSENCVRFPLGEGSRGGEIEEDKIAQGDFSCCCKLFLAFNRCLW